MKSEPLVGRAHDNVLWIGYLGKDTAAMPGTSHVAAKKNRGRCGSRFSSLEVLVPPGPSAALFIRQPFYRHLYSLLVFLAKATPDPFFSITSALT